MKTVWLAPKTRILIIGLVLVITSLGFGLRLLYALRPYFHPDEYVAMLAARMVAEKGAPILPSGLWYNPELTFSYASGLFIGLFGARDFAVRWTSVFFGALSAPLAYIAARRILSSSWAGLAAAAVLATAPEAVLWGGRARRYAMGEFLLLLLLWLIWVGLVAGDSRKYRLWFYLVLALAGLTIPQAVMVIPPLFLALAGLALFNAPLRSRLLRRQFVIEVILIGLIALALFGLIRSNFVAAYAAGFASERLQEVDNSTLAEGAAALSPFLLPTFDLAAASTKLRWLVLLEPLYRVLALPAGLAVLLSLLPGPFDSRRFRQPVWFLLLVAGGVAFEFLFLVSADWTGPRPRYLFVSLWPALVMLACGAVAAAEHLVRRWFVAASFPRWTPWVRAPLALLLLLGVGVFTLPRTLGHLARSAGDEINYHQAYQFVLGQWQPGDQIMTVLTTASYWYLGQTDYYARDIAPFVFENNRGEPVDSWTGARWVSQPAELDQVLGNERVWFVIDASRLWNVYTLAFKQQLLARLKLIHQTGNVFVLLPKADGPAIPSQPEETVAANFAGQVELVGFALDEAALAAGQPAQLTLFWKTLRPLPEYKVFVHLRNADNQTIAQADHVPSESLVALPTNTWRVGEVVPDVTYLTVPPNVSAGNYRLLVGMYNPTTSERLPVQHDSSGENAVVLSTFQVP